MSETIVTNNNLREIANAENSDKIFLNNIAKIILENKENNLETNFLELATKTNLIQLRSFSFCELKKAISQVKDEATFIEFLKLYFHNFNEIAFLQKIRILTAKEKKQIERDALLKRLSILDGEIESIEVIK